MKYRKKPVEALKWDPNPLGYPKKPWPKNWKSSKLWEVSAIDLSLYLSTLGGLVKVLPGDWIIKDVNGKYCSCKPYIFKEEYEVVDDDCLAEEERTRG